MIRENFLISKLKSGRPAIGTWSMIPSPITSDIIASSGIDFLIIDREHGPISFETAQEMSIACESRKVSPVMRVGDIDKQFIQNALDIGVHGIQVPNIDLKSKAMDVVEYSKFPPLGNRGFSPFVRAGNYSIESSQSLTKIANQNTIVVLNIEGQDAIKNLDSILEVESVDIIFVGLFDLSKSLNIPGDVKNPRVLKKLSEIIEKASAAKKYVGSISTDFESLQQFVNMGVMYLTHLVDCEILRSGYSSIVNEFERSILKLDQRSV